MSINDNPDKTPTAQEALRLLKEKRAAIISLARGHAAQLIAERGGPGVGEITTRDVRAAMVAGGDYSDLGNDLWLGGVFLTRAFKKTGRQVTATYEDATENRKLDRKPHGGMIIHYWTLSA